MHTVLVVDDEPGIRRVLRRLLEKRGFAVVEAATAEAAYAEIIGGGIAAVLCDIMLPGKSGIELCDECIAKAPALLGRWVFLTAAASEREVLDKVEARGVPILSKLHQLEFAVDAIQVALLPRGG
jgi:CheY-like chemotaxis protein